MFFLYSVLEFWMEYFFSAMPCSPINVYSNKAHELKNLEEADRVKKLEEVR